MPILESFNPSNGHVIWAGQESSLREIDSAVETAKSSQKSWRALDADARAETLQQFAQTVERRAEHLALAIAEEVGKPLWEAKTEVNSLKTKVAACIAAYRERANTRAQEVAGRTSVTRFVPHGVLAVIGPFNFPMSMPNSHVMPALLAGNSVVLKPSERSPRAGELYRDIWLEAGLPEGVLQLVQGGPTVGGALVNHQGIDGVLFIGSRAAGLSISSALAEDTSKIVTLEMGGSGALVVWSYSDIRVAVHIAIQSAFITAGQRCSSARRLIVNSQIADEFLEALETAVRQISVGDPLSPDHFMGPLIDERATSTYLDQVENLVGKGCVPIVVSDRIAGLGTNYVSPGLIEVPSGVSDPDVEIFGPLLRVYRVESLADAIDLANETIFGLSAGIVSTSRDDYELFLDGVESGIVNWNQSLTGATTSAPFGGAKGSGNHRPAGYLSVDYCSRPVASIEDLEPSVPNQLPPGLGY